MSVYIYILMVVVTVYVSCEVIDQSEGRIIDHVIHVIWNYRVKLISKTVGTFGDKVTILVRQTV